MREILFKAKIQGTDNWIEGFPHTIYKGAIDSLQDLETGETEYIKTDTLGQQCEMSLGITAFTGDLVYANCIPCCERRATPKKMLCRITDSGKGCEVSIWYKLEWWAYRQMDYTSIEVVGNIHDGDFSHLLIHD